MPLTPLHVVPAWTVFLTRPRKWSFAGLSMGSVIPDLEIPVLYLSGLETQTGHGPFHSIVGALTIDAMLAILAVYLLYASLAGLWEGRFGTKWIHFGGVNVGDIESFPRIALGAYVGTSLHVSLDFLTHTTMPYLWPYSNPVRTLPFAKDLWWILAVNLTLLALLLVLVRRYLGKMEDSLGPR